MPFPLRFGTPCMCVLHTRLYACIGVYVYNTYMRFEGVPKPSTSGGKGIIGAVCT